MQYFTQTLILLIYCAVGHLLSTITKNLIQFGNLYQFIQRMNKACHMSSNYSTSLYQFKQLKFSGSFVMSEQFRRSVIGELYASFNLITTVPQDGV